MDDSLVARFNEGREEERTKGIGAVAISMIHNGRVVEKVQKLTYLPIKHISELIQNFAK